MGPNAKSSMQQRAISHDAAVGEAASPSVLDTLRSLVANVGATPSKPEPNEALRSFLSPPEAERTSPDPSQRSGDSKDPDREAAMNIVRRMRIRMA